MWVIALELGTELDIQLYQGDIKITISTRYRVITLPRISPIFSSKTSSYSRLSRRRNTNLI